MCKKFGFVPWLTPFLGHPDLSGHNRTVEEAAKQKASLLSSSSLSYFLAGVWRVVMCIDLPWEVPRKCGRNSWPLFLQCLCGGEPSVTVLWHQHATNIMESSLLETLLSGLHAEKGNSELSKLSHRFARKQNWVKFGYVWVQAKGSFSTLLVFTGEMHQKVSPLVNSCQQWYWRNVSPTQNDTALKASLQISVLSTL